MTARGAGVALAAVLLWLAARSFGVPQLHVAALAAVVVLVAALVYTRLPLRLTVERTLLPTTVWFGQDTRVVLRLHNAGALAVPPVMLEDDVPAVLGPRPRATLATLGAGRHATVEHTLRGAHRGRFTVGPLWVTLSDPFGLVARRRALHSTASLTVYPPIDELPAGIPLGQATESGGVGPRRPGITGGELADVREYVRGDDLRAVHWPSTAHRGRLMVRNPEATRAAHATLLLDARLGRHAGHGPESSFETAVRAAASAAYHLARRGRGAVLMDRPVAARPAPVPWPTLLEILADARPAELDLPGLLEQLATRLDGGGTLLAVVTTPTARELRGLVRAGRGSPSRLALVIDPAPHRGAPADVAADRATAGLRAAGWRAVTLRPGDRLDERWQRLLVQRQARIPNAAVR